MDYIEICLLALALSIDACIVSFSYGLTFKANRFKTAILLACFTSFFQALMPILGYYLTNFVKSFIQPYASWIVFSIFIYLGIKFIFEAFENDKSKRLCLDLKCLLLLGIATSIDAFSAGISLLLFGNKILKPALLTGFITFINSLLGFCAGGKLMHLSTRFLEVFAGILLIFLGIKAVV